MMHTQLRMTFNFGSGEDAKQLVARCEKAATQLNLTTSQGKPNLHALGRLALNKLCDEVLGKKLEAEKY